ncbi:chemotaxis protein CheW [Leptolyngbya iicbica]|nr:chemotaxis protein CheW [Leptolyngbya sp. LK]
MAYQPYLIFGLSGSRFGIAAAVVQELFLLPALTPIAEATAEMVGILNLRGHIIPVIDLRQRLGRSRQPYTLKHSVILIRLHERSVGVIVDEVDNVEFIAESELAIDVGSHLTTDAEHAVTAGLAKHDSQLITLLNPEALVQGSSMATGTARPEPIDANIEGNEFLAQFSAADQAVLQNRADALINQSESESWVGLTALAIVGLQGERFALNLEVIQEFTQIAQVTPVPCCPPHIVGNMNLRGEILTLIDIRQFVNLDTASTRQQQAVIVRVNDIVAGIIVDAVFDVLYVHPGDVTAVPTAIHATDNAYIRGVVRDNGQTISVLDITQLLTHGELVVDQAA